MSCYNICNNKAYDHMQKDLDVPSKVGTDGIHHWS